MLGECTEPAGSIWGRKTGLLWLITKVQPETLPGLWYLLFVHQDHDRCCKALSSVMLHERWEMELVSKCSGMLGVSSKPERSMSLLCQVLLGEKSLCSNLWWFFRRNLMEFENQETEMKINNLLVNSSVIRTDQGWRSLFQTFFLVPSCFMLM